MANDWINHVKKTAQEHRISYKEALKVASKTYKKGKSGKGMTQELYNQVYHVGQQKPMGLLYKANPMAGKGLKKSKKGKGFFDDFVNAVDKVGTDAGKAFPINPYSIGREIGENYIGPALLKSMKK